jgi:peptidoglycan/xylan/chitin deacetylase (PgdA/CDA1 family)
MESNPLAALLGTSRRVIFLAFLVLALTLGIIGLAGCNKSNPAQPSESGQPEGQSDTAAGSGSGAGNGGGDTVVSTVPVFDPPKPEVINRGNPNRRMVALTIDDGWNRDDRILDLLRAQNVPATTFLIGGRGVAEGDPAWVKSLDDAGLEVCSHTYDHYKLTDHPEEYIADDIKHGLDVIQSITGKRLPYMRPPGGFVNEAVIQAAVENRCYVVMWTSAFGDTNDKVTADQEVQSVLANLCNGDIILCHWGGYYTYQAMSRLIPEIRAGGYEFGTLSQVLAP